MQKLLLLLAFLLMASIPLAAQSRFLDDTFTQISKRTMTYAQKDGQELKMDIYAPEGDSLTYRPALIWVHGGGFAGGSRDNGDEVKLMNQLAQKGYVAISISYRLLRKGKKEGFGCDCSRQEKMRVFRESAADLLDAVLFVKGKKEELGVNEDKVIIGGSSAGAETVLNAAYMRDWFFPANETYRELKFAAVWSLAGAVVDARYLTADNALPTLLFHGTADRLVPFGSAPHHYCRPEQAGYMWLDGSRSITTKLSALKQSHLLYTLVDGNHDMAQIPFDQLPLILSFLKEVALEGQYQAVSMEEK